MANVKGKMALVGRYVYRHDTGQRHFGSIEEKVIHRYFLLLYFSNFCGMWVYAEEKNNFPKILYKVYNFLIDFLWISVIVIIEQMKQEACESVLCQINIVKAFYEYRHSNTGIQQSSGNI